MSKTFNMNEIYCIAVAIVIFVLLLMIIMSSFMEDCLLKGFWRATDNFCNEAELELFLVYIGDNTSYIGHNRPGFLLAANSDGVILNNPVDINFGLSVKLLPGMANCKKYNAEIDWHGEPPEDENVFPSEVQIAFYPQHGKLIFYRDDEVLAILWKDQEMSSMDIEQRLLPSEISDVGTEDIGAETFDEDNFTDTGYEKNPDDNEGQDEESAEYNRDNWK
jgi:hypothetical protein